MLFVFPPSSYKLRLKRVVRVCLLHIGLYIHMHYWSWWIWCLQAYRDLYTWSESTFNFRHSPGWTTCTHTTLSAMTWLSRIDGTARLFFLQSQNIPLYTAYFTQIQLVYRSSLTLRYMYAPTLRAASCARFLFCFVTSAIGLPRHSKKK